MLWNKNILINGEFKLHVRVLEQTAKLFLLDSRVFSGYPSSLRFAYITIHFIKVISRFSLMWEIYTRKNAKLFVFARWQDWTWLSWPAWTALLTGLFMHVGTDCSWLDERTDLNNVVGTIMINQQSCSCMSCCQGMMN